MAALLQRRTLPRIILCALLVAACGKRGDPTPPIPIVPQAVRDLTATQRGITVVLSWTYPSLTTAGRSLGKIERILVYRHIDPLPPALVGKDPQAITDVPPDTPVEVVLFTQVPLLAPPQFIKLREVLTTIEKEELAEFTEGARVFFEDNPPIRTPDRRPVRVTYAVVTEAQAKSELSNLATIVPLDVPRAPQNVTATPAPEGVTLRWDPPAVTLTGATEPPLVGYNVYRFDAAEPPSDLGAPLNPAPIRDTTFQDTPPYGSHRYAVTAVRSVGPPLLQSVTSNAVLVEFRDLLPPPVPTGLAALPEENAIRLIWEAVEAPDLAGYKVYRELGGDRQLLTSSPIADTFFRDERVTANVSYSYFVSSVDQLGNESEPAAARDVIVRR